MTSRRERRNGRRARCDNAGAGLDIGVAWILARIVIADHVTVVVASYPGDTGVYRVRHDSEVSGSLDVPAVERTGGDFNRTPIASRLFRVELDRPAFGVHPSQGSLRAAQNFDAGK